MKRSEYIHQISSYASKFVLEVEGLNQSNLYDINIHSENFLIPILNEIFQLSLENLNSSQRKHFPAIDLTDWNKKVAFQITATSNGKKIKETIKKFREYKLDNFFDDLYIYIITHKKSKYNIDLSFTENFKFSIEKNIIDKDDLLKKISEITSIDTIEKIAKIYQDEFAEEPIQLKFEKRHQKANAKKAKLQLKKESSIISNIPSNIDFLGREKDLDIVRSAIDKTSKEWGILISGIGGIGKTSLALTAAYEALQKDSFKAFIFLTAKKSFLEPNGIIQDHNAVLLPEDFINETVRLLCKEDLFLANKNNKKEIFLELLKKIPTLIIYDNLETLSEENQNLIAHFLIGLPIGSKAILTSRRQGAEGGRHLSLNDLDWKTAKEIIFNDSNKDNILSLKINKCKSRWKELYTETCGSPLALKHILGLLRVKRSLSFDGAIQLLKSKSGLSDRISFMFNEAQDELTKNDKTILCAISYFASNASITSLKDITGLSLDEVIRAIDHIGKLCLLDLSAMNDSYKIHPLTKEFIETSQENKDSYNRIGINFAKYWVNFSKEFGGDKNYSYKTYDHLEQEWGNINSAINLLLNASNDKSSINFIAACMLLNELAKNIKQFLLYSGRWDDRIFLSEKCYKLMSITKDKYNQGWRAYDISFTYINRGNLIKAKVWIDKAIEAWDFELYKEEEGEATRLLGIIADRKGELENAKEYYETAIPIFDSLGDKKNKSIVLSDLGILFTRTGNFVEAEKSYNAAIQETPFKPDKAFYLRLLGDLNLKQNKTFDAENCYLNALRLCRKNRIYQVIAGSFLGLAIIEENRGDLSKALRYAKKALKIREQLQHFELKSTYELVKRLEQKYKNRD